MRAFFTAPVVVFHLNILSYFAFLFLFAFVLVVDFQPAPSWSERLIYVWLFSLVCEELRQVRAGPGIGLGPGWGGVPRAEQGCHPPPGVPRGPPRERERER